jgi:hypothetical protein
VTKLSYPPPRLTMNAELLQWAEYSKALAQLLSFPSKESQFSQPKAQLSLRLQRCQIAWEPLVDGGVRSLRRSIFLEQRHERRDSCFPAPPFEAPTYLHALDILGRFTVSGLISASHQGLVKFLPDLVVVTWTHFFLSNQHLDKIADWLRDYQMEADYQKICFEAKNEVYQLLDPGSGALLKSELRRKWGRKYLEERAYNDMPYAILEALFICGSLQQKSMPSQLNKRGWGKPSLDIIGAFVNDLVLHHLVTDTDDYQLTYLGRQQYLEWQELYWSDKPKD